MEPLKIEGVIVERVGSPLDDGGAGSGLYAVPLRLNRSVTEIESGMIPRAWDHPPLSTTEHRAGICRVSGDVLTLDRTTIDEVEQVHAQTLKAVLEYVNAESMKIVTKQQEKAQAAVDAKSAHQAHVKEVAERLHFDE
jgi:hypothetical protein